MSAAPLPDDEAARLRSLHTLRILDTEPEQEFDALVRVAAAVCGVPISLLSLIDADRQWFKANVGLPEISETTREMAFCAHSILGNGLFEVSDATRDARFMDNPAVLGAPDIRFYAGAPLRLSDGSRVGTLCVMDRHPRRLDSLQRQVLGELATATVQLLEGRRALSLERELRAAADQAAAVLRHSRDAIVVLDQQGVVTHWNQAAQRMFGHSAQQMTGRPFDPAVLGMAAEQGLSDPVQRLLAQPDGSTYQATCRARDGQDMMVSVSLAPVIDQDELITGATLIIRDVSAHQRLMRALAESEARFRGFSNNLPLGVFATDSQGACTYVNTRWLAIYGTDEAAALSDGWSKTLHPDDRDAVVTQWQHSMTEACDFDMEFRVLRAVATAADAVGEVRLVHARATAMRDAAGRVMGYVGSTDDVTALRRTQRALADQRERLDRILAGTGAGTWEWQVQTGQAIFNERWAQLIGYSLAELGDISIETWRNHIHPDDRRRSDALLAQHLRGELPHYEMEARMRHRDGHWVWVLARGRVMSLTADGQPEWMFGTHLDISAIKQAQAAEQQTRQLLDSAGRVAGVGTWVLELPSLRLSWSDRTRLMYGVAEDHVPSVAEAIDFYAPEARPVVRAAVEAAATTGKGWDLELPFLPADGRSLWVRTVGEVERDADGQPVRLLGALQDITQRVQQQQALAAAHERIKLATESGGIGIWEINIATGEARWDGWMYRLFGHQSDCSVPPVTVWAQRLHPDDRSLIDARVRQLILGDRDLDTEFRIVLDDGSIRHLRSSARAVRDERGRALRMLGANWDVTALHQATAP